VLLSSSSSSSGEAPWKRRSKRRKTASGHSLNTERHRTIAEDPLHQYTDHVYDLGANGNASMMHSIGKLTAPIEERETALGRLPMNNGKLYGEDELKFVDYDAEWIRNFDLRREYVENDPMFVLGSHIASLMGSSIQDLQDTSLLEDRLAQTRTEIYREQLQAKREIVTTNAKNKQIEALRALAKDMELRVIYAKYALRDIRQLKNVVELANSYYSPIVRRADDIDSFPILGDRKGNHVVDELLLDYLVFNKISLPRDEDLSPLFKSKSALSRSILYNRVKSLYVTKSRVGNGMALDDKSKAELDAIYTWTFLYVHRFLDYDCMDDEYVDAGTGRKRKYPAKRYYSLAVLRFMKRMTPINTEDNKSYDLPDLPDYDTTTQVFPLRVDPDKENLDSTVGLGNTVHKFNERKTGIDKIIEFMIENYKPMRDGAAFKELKKYFIGGASWLKKIATEYYNLSDAIKTKMYEEGARDRRSPEYVPPEPIVDGTVEARGAQRDTTNTAPLTKKERRERERIADFSKNPYWIQLPPRFTKEDVKSTLGSDFPFSFVQSPEIKSHLDFIIRERPDLRELVYDYPKTQIDDEFVLRRVREITGNPETTAEEASLLHTDPVTSLERIYASANRRAKGATSTIVPYQLYKKEYKLRLSYYTLENNETTIISVLFAESYAMGIYLYEHAHALLESYNNAIEQTSMIMKEVSMERTVMPSKESLLKKYLNSGRSSLEWRMTPEISGKVIWNNQIIRNINDTLAQIRRIQPPLAGITIDDVIREENRDFLTIFARVLVSNYQQHFSGQAGGFVNKVVNKNIYLSLEGDYQMLGEYGFEEVYDPKTKKTDRLIVNKKRRYANIEQVSGTGAYSPW
jgi:hypothetical protein